MIAAETIGQAITPSSRSSLRAHSMSSRRSKSFRFLQIISAANKQYAGARAPDRQQAAKPAAALATCIPLRRFAAFAASLYSMLPLVFRFAASLLSLHAQRLLLIVISHQSAAILVLFVGRRYYLRPVSRFAAFSAFSVAAKAAKAMVSAIAFMAVHSARVQRPLSGT